MTEVNGNCLNELQTVIQSFASLKSRAAKGPRRTVSAFKKIQNFSQVVWEPYEYRNGLVTSEADSKQAEVITVQESVCIYFTVPIPTHYMYQGPACEADGLSASKEIPHRLWNTRVQYHVKKSPPLALILNQLKPVTSSQPASLWRILILSPTYA